MAGDIQPKRKESGASAKPAAGGKPATRQARLAAAFDKAGAKIEAANRRLASDMKQAITGTPAKVAPAAGYIKQLQDAGLDRGKVAAIVETLKADKALKAADLKAIARDYRGGGAMPTSGGAALKAIETRGLELVRNTNQIKQAALARPWAIVAPLGVITAAALAYDATKSTASASGLAPRQATANAVGAGAKAALTATTVGVVAKKIFSAGAAVAPVASKVLARVLPVAAVVAAGWGAYQGYQQSGNWRGAAVGALTGGPIPSFAQGWVSPTISMAAAPKPPVAPTAPVAGAFLNERAAKVAAAARDDRAPPQRQAAGPVSGQPQQYKTVNGRQVLNPWFTARDRMKAFGKAA